MTGALILLGLLAGYGLLIAAGIWGTPRDEHGMVASSRRVVEHHGTQSQAPARSSDPAPGPVGAGAQRQTAPTGPYTEGSDEP